MSVHNVQAEVVGFTGTHGNVFDIGDSASETTRTLKVNQLGQSKAAGNIQVLDHLTIADTKNVVVDTLTGTKIGTGITQKLGFYGAAPIARRSGAAQAAVATTASTSTTPFGYTTAAQADAIVTLVNELRAWAVAQGFIAGA